MPTHEYTVQFVIPRPAVRHRSSGAFWRYVAGCYNLAVPVLAALTPDEFKVGVTDQAVHKINYDCDADIIALSFMTSHAVEAYRIADEFRKRGRIVVMGGIHATALPEEAKQHADAVECLAD